jgi:predicted dehydrogenase
MGGWEPVKRAVEAFYASRNDGNYKGCNTYTDYRDLINKQADLDAVYIATPDHWHAAIANLAMRRRKHVLCQKPMAHAVSEARHMAMMAREMRVATSTPVTNTSSEVTRVIKAWIDDGAIGPVREVHNWTGRPYWPQGIERPKEAEPIPEGLDWNMWVGPAADRPFNNAYLPFVWRGWQDFGCGSYGDMGCYSFSGLFNILNLTPPVSVECQSSECFAETFPKASVVYLDFPEHHGRPAIHMTWYDGGIRPARPYGMLADDERLFQHTSNGDGVMYIGDKGIILAGFNGDHPRIYPENKKYQYVPPSRQRGASAENAPGNVIDQWVKACKGGPASSSHFEQQAPVSEAFLLGCLAQRFPGEKFIWDTAAMRVTNSEKANQYVNPSYRGGFTG